jgi:hypothetical protein
MGADCFSVARPTRRTKSRANNNHDAISDCD